MEVISQMPVTLPEAKELMEKRASKSELGFEQANAMEHAKKFAKLEDNKAREAVKKLVELGLTERQAVKLVDLMPKTEDNVKLFMQVGKDGVDVEKAKKALEVLKEY